MAGVRPGGNSDTVLSSNSYPVQRTRAGRLIPPERAVKNQKHKCCFLIFRQHDMMVPDSDVRQGMDIRSMMKRGKSDPIQPLSPKWMTARERVQQGSPKSPGMTRHTVLSCNTGMTQRCSARKVQLEWWYVTECSHRRGYAYYA